MLTGHSLEQVRVTQTGEGHRYLTGTGDRHRSLTGTGGGHSLPLATQSIAIAETEKKGSLHNVPT